MPDGMNTSSGNNLMVQRGRGGFPGGGPGGMPRGGFPGGGPGGMPRGGFPGGGPGGFPHGGFPGRRFPRPFPVRQRFPRFFFFPVTDFGFPAGRCYFIDEFGRCCDRYGRCCDRYGRCFFSGGFDGYASAPRSNEGWYGIPGGWDMMPDYDEMASYDMDDMDDMED